MADSIYSRTQGTDNPWKTWDKQVLDKDNITRGQTDLYQSTTRDLKNSAANTPTPFALGSASLLIHPRTTHISLHSIPFHWNFCYNIRVQCVSIYAFK